MRCCVRSTNGICVGRVFYYWKVYIGADLESKLEKSEVGSYPKFIVLFNVELDMQCARKVPLILLYLKVDSRGVSLGFL